MRKEKRGGSAEIADVLSDLDPKLVSQHRLLEEKPSTSVKKGKLDGKRSSERQDSFLHRTSRDILVKDK